MSILGKFELNEQAEMEFGCEIFGTTEGAQTARLVIEGKDFDIGCKCEVVNGEIIAHIPKLKGILESGLYDVRLEVVVNDKLFVPMKEQIELNPLIEFDVKTKKVEAVKEGVKITAKTKLVSEDTKPVTSKLDSNIQKVVAEGFEVSKIGDHYVMKKGEQYCGLVSENKILKSKFHCASLTELIESLS